MQSKNNFFLISLIFDISFFSVCVCIWLYIRKNRDENKINDNIYILNSNTNNELKEEYDTIKNEKTDIKPKKKPNIFKTFLNIRDEKIVNTEIKFYLFFLKTNRNIIFSLCILGTFLALPVYLFLPRNDNNNPSFLDYMSASSVTDINVIIILFFITLIYSGIGYYFIYLLWKKIKPSKKKMKKFLPQNFTIMVSNINRDDINAFHIYRYFCNLTNNKVVSVYLILDYSLVFNVQKKIFHAIKKLKILKESEKKKKERENSKENIFRIFWRKNDNNLNNSLMLINEDIIKSNLNEVNVFSDEIISPMKKQKLSNDYFFENDVEIDECNVRENIKQILNSRNFSFLFDDEDKKDIYSKHLSNSNDNKSFFIEKEKNKHFNKKCEYMHKKKTEIKDKKKNSYLFSDNILKKENNTEKNDHLNLSNSNEQNKNIHYKKIRENFENKKLNKIDKMTLLKEVSDENETLSEEKSKLKNSCYKYKINVNDENHLNTQKNSYSYSNVDQNNQTKSSSIIKTKSKLKKCPNIIKSNCILNFIYIIKEKQKKFWKNKLKENIIKFYSIINEIPKKSTGVCFVSFIDTKSVHDCIHNIPYNQKNNKWVISKAPPHYDIIWKNLKNQTYEICARFVILNALLLLINIIIINITSVSWIDRILKVTDSKNNNEDNTNYFKVAFTAWFSPFIVIFVNSFVQPILISCVSVMVGFIRKSSEHNYVLKGNFFFLILNTIIIPLLSLSPLNALIKLLYSEEIKNLSERLGQFLFNSSGFFAMRYILNCYFLTCANQLLQIPQFSIRAIYEKITKKETDTWTFDFGYWYAFNTSILALILTFSVSVPLILPLGSLYFFLRYYIDKYNLIYEICRTNLDSHGAIVRTAIKFQLFSVAFFQMVMFGFFFKVENKFISIGRNFLFLSSSITTLVLLCRSAEWISTHHIKKKKGENTFCYLCEKNMYVSSLKDLNKLKYAYANPCESRL